MVDEIEIWRDPQQTYDSDTLIASFTGGNLVYEGKGRVRPTRGPREQAISEGVIALRDADFLIPINATTPRRDDEVFVKSSEDPSLEGTWFRITDVRAFSQQAARGFSALQGQPSRLWPNLSEEGDDEEDDDNGDD